MQEVTGPLSDDAVSAAAGFGGGIGRCQSVCGAIVAGVMLIGIHEGLQPRPARELATAARAPARQLFQSFAARFGATDCRQLTGYDFSTPEGVLAFADSGGRVTKCGAYIAHVVEQGLALTALAVAGQAP